MNTTADIAVTVELQPLPWACYTVGDGGEFAARGERPAAENETCVIAVAGVPGAHVPITYDRAAARTAAAQLLGYAHRHEHPATSVPATITTTLLSPTERTATTTTWDLGDGFVLCYRVPFDVTLAADVSRWWLTPNLATRWARALLAVAAELDSAYAHATHAIRAQRTGTTTARNVLDWLRGLAHELTAEQQRLAGRVRKVLYDEDSIARGDVLFDALDIAHPDLPMPLSDLWLVSAETIGHREVAEVITQLAHRYAIPHYLWTADNGFIRDEGVDLTESQWRRVARSVELREFAQVLDHRQSNGSGAVDVKVALYEAGVLCRACDEILDDRDVATTWGHCDECRPDTLADLARTACPADDGEASRHALGSAGQCRPCNVPLPADYPGRA